MDDTPEHQPDFLLVGRILRPHGVRGELRIQVMTDYPERLVESARLAIGPDVEDKASVTVYDMERARLHQGYLIAKLQSIDDRTTAENLREQYVMIPLEEAVPLEEDEYYFFQLIGLEMVTLQGETLGHVTEILETGANEVYVVQGPRYGEVLIPAIASVIQSIDIEQRRITIDPIPGLLPDAS